jgi:hypothetical protein
MVFPGIRLIILSADNFGVLVEAFGVVDGFQIAAVLVVVWTVVFLSCTAIVILISDVGHVLDEFVSVLMGVPAVAGRAIPRVYGEVCWWEKLVRYG